MGGEIKSFRDLVAWQKAIQLCKRVYAASKTFPDAERFGLTAHIRRAAVSVPSNIAEGYGRRRKQDYVRFLDIAHGSLCEVDTQLVLAEELEFASKESLSPSFELLGDVDRLLYALIRAVEESEPHRRA
jgi:four helix bundle protein